MLPAHGTHDAEACVKAQSEAMKRLLDLIGTPAKCRGCEAPIYWLKHLNGKSVPYESSGLNHFISCPESARFKR